jgi:hypothetical protein
MSVLAHNGLGRSFLYRQDYQRAQYEFEVAGNRAYYSQAFWEVRNQWLMENLTAILLALIALYIVSGIVKRADRKKVLASASAKIKNVVMNAPYLNNILFSITVARHPLDSFYYLKIKQKGSLPGAAVNFLFFFASYLIYQVGKGYILQFAEVEDLDFNIIIGGFAGVYFLFVFCNYLVTSINDGEGGGLDIFKLTSYAMLPLSCTLILVTALTHVITLNEVFLLNFMMLGGFTWTGVLLWLGLQEVHNYSFGVNLRNILLTAVFMLIALVIIFNMLVLFDQFAQFIEAVAREAYGNVTGLY